MPDGEALSKIVINGQEFDPADAQELIELGTKTRDFESKWNTSLDKVYPDYTRATQKAARADELERELEETKRQAAEFQAKLDRASTPKAQADVIKAAREAGLADQEWLREQGYMTKADVEQMLSARKTEEQQANEVLKKADELESKIDGSDGRQPFIKEAVLAYAYTYGITDLEEAYEKMNERLNTAWKQREIDKAKTKGLTTQTAGGSKNPPSTGKVDDSNVRDLLKEALWGTGE